MIEQIQLIPKVLAAFATSLVMGLLRTWYPLEDMGLEGPTLTLVNLVVDLVMAGVVALATWLVSSSRAFWDREITARLTNRLIIAAQHVENSPVDLSKIITNEIVAEAQANPNSPVDLSKIITNKEVMQAQLDPLSPVSMPADTNPSELMAKLKELDERDEMGQPQAEGVKV